VIPITALQRLQVFADDAYTTDGSKLASLLAYINGVPNRSLGLGYWGRQADGSYGEDWGK
jgi:hypothetical protein